MNVTVYKLKIKCVRVYNFLTSNVMLNIFLQTNFNFISNFFMNFKLRLKSIFFTEFMRSNIKESPHIRYMSVEKQNNTAYRQAKK